MKLSENIRRGTFNINLPSEISTEDLVILAKLMRKGPSWSDVVNALERVLFSRKEQ